MKVLYAFSIGCRINWIDSINRERINRLSLRFTFEMWGHSIIGRDLLWIAINPFSRQGGVALWWHTPRLTRVRLAPLFERAQKQWRGIRGVAGSLNASSNPFCQLVESRKRPFACIYDDVDNRLANRMDFRLADLQCGKIKSRTAWSRMLECLHTA